MKKIAILGGGAWGSALANVIARRKYEIMLWARDAKVVQDINESRKNSAHLPGIVFKKGIKATTNSLRALKNADCVLAVVPAQEMRFVLKDVANGIKPDIPIVLCCKGIEKNTGSLISRIVEETLPHNPPCALSGPSFALDVAQGLPTAVTIATRDIGLAHSLVKSLSSATFRCYSSVDLVGVEIGGALKNVLAIGVGIVAGRGLGDSARAALITRGFVELRRLGKTFGAKEETIMGLSGLGDLILTCSSMQSRNFTYGLMLGKGEDVSNLPLAEGKATAFIAARIAKQHEIEAPIIEMIAKIIGNQISIERAISTILSRPLRKESYMSDSKNL